MSWENELPPEERARWDEFVHDFRSRTLDGIAKSSAGLSLVPRGGEFDVKYATELGAMLLLDKPLILVVAPGQDVPERLARAADRIVAVDLDTEDGQRQIADALKEVVG